MDELNGILVGIPETMANLQLPDPNLRDYYRDEQNRIFWVDDEINASLLELVKMIIRCNKEDKDKSLKKEILLKYLLIVQVEMFRHYGLL